MRTSLHWELCPGQAEVAGGLGWNEWLSPSLTASVAAVAGAWGVSVPRCDRWRGKSVNTLVDEFLMGLLYMIYCKWFNHETFMVHGDIAWYSW